MNKKQTIIYQMLLARPDFVYITPDGKEAYLLLPRRGMVVLTASPDTNWNNYGVDELNRLIQDWIIDQI